MGVAGQTPRGGGSAATPKITHVVTGLTEIAFPLEPNLQQMLIQNPTGAAIRYSYVLAGTGGSTDEWVELAPCTSRELSGINFSGTIYLLASAVSHTVHIEQWV